MNIFLIRHGQSTNNALTDVGQRVQDADLTPLGEQQAVRLGDFIAARLDEFPITQLYCSPMLRTLKTVRPVSEALGLSPQVWVDLHENGGVFLEEGEGHFVGYPGMARDEVAAAFPDYTLPADLTTRGWWDPAAGLEADEDRHARARRVAEALWARARSSNGTGRDEVLALVSHHGALNFLLSALTRQGNNTDRRLTYHHHNTGITRLDITADYGISFHYLNHIEHLPLDLRSW